MSRLGAQLTEGGAEPQSESRISQRLSDIVTENRKAPRDEEDFKVERIDEDEIEVPREDYGNMTEEARDWDRAEDAGPQPVLDGIGYGGNYNINIETITSGYILRVGCQTIAVESGADVGTLIGIYLSGDKTIGDKWMNSDKIVQNFIKENLQVK
jgi:hypothetical protein